MPRNEKATRRTTGGSSFPDRLHSSVRTLNSLLAVPRLSTQSLSPHGSKVRLRPHPFCQGGFPGRAKVCSYLCRRVDSTVPPENRSLVRFPDCTGFSEFASDSPVRPSSRLPRIAAWGLLVRTAGPSRFPQSRPCGVTLVCTLPLLGFGSNSTPSSEADSRDQLLQASSPLSRIDLHPLGS